MRFHYLCQTNTLLYSETEGCGQRRSGQDCLRAQSRAVGPQPVAGGCPERNAMKNFLIALVLAAAVASPVVSAVMSGTGSSVASAAVSGGVDQASNTHFPYD
jgi:hypothetical protein